MMVARGLYRMPEPWFESIKDKKVFQKVFAYIGIFEKDFRDWDTYFMSGIQKWESMSYAEKWEVNKVFIDELNI